MGRREQRHARPHQTGGTHRWRTGRPQDEPRGQWLRLPRLRLAGRPARPAPRHLREWDQARDLGDDEERVGPEFFAAHTVTELTTWTDFALEDAGRLTEPLPYDAASDTYVPISWPDAFELVGAVPQAREPRPGRVLHLGTARQRGDVPSTSSSPANSGRTTCPTARTCATRRASGRSPRRSGPARAPSTSRTGTGRISLS